MSTPDWNPRNPLPATDKRKPCVLLIPGTWCNGRVWRPQIKALKNAGMDAIAIDTTPFDNISSMTKAVLAGAPQHFSVAGFSSGGYCALDLVRQAPARVSRLALVATQASAAGEDFEKPQTLAMLDAARANPFESVIDGILPALVADSNDADARRVITRMAGEVGINGLQNQVAALLDRRDSTPLLSSIAQPTLVVAGEHDALIPAEQQRAMASRIEHARFVQLDGVGHMTPLENPAGLADLLVEWFGR